MSAFCVVCQVSVAPVEDWAWHCQSRPHVKGTLSADFSPDGNRLQCNVCGVQVMRGNESQHLLGRKHQHQANTPLEDAEDGDDSDKSEEEFDEVLPPGGQEIRDAGGRCDLCGGVAIGVLYEPIAIHVRGAKHQLQMKIRASKFNFKTMVDQAGYGGTSVSVSIVEMASNGKGVSVGGATKHPITAFVGKATKFQILVESKQKTSLKQLLCVPPFPASLCSTMPTGQFGFSAKKRAFTFDCTVTPSEVGVHRTLLGLAFTGPVVRLLTLEVRALNSPAQDDQMRLIAATAPYEKPAYKRASLGSLVENLVPGARVGSVKTQWIVKLKAVNPPPTLAFLKNPDIVAKFAKLGGRLDAQNYASWFRDLLFLEALQQKIDIAVFDLYVAFDSWRGGYLGLEVPGLAEARPSLLVGDAIHACECSFDAGHQQGKAKPKVWEGIVHHVEQNRVLLRFDPAFHAKYIGQKFHVRFTINPVPMWRCHQAVEVLAKVGPQALARLFPVQKALAAPTASVLASSSVLSSSSSGRRPLQDNFAQALRVLCTDIPFEASEWIQRHVTESNVKHVGLDTESRISRGPGFPNELALIQIATEQAVLIYRVFSGRDQVDIGVSKLVVLLENESIVKYAIGHDAKELHDAAGIEVKHAINLQAVAHSQFRHPNKQTGTQELVRDFLGLESWTKNKELQRSDWGAWPLSSAQKTYAASDVFLALHIGLEMTRRLEIEGSSSSSAASAPTPAPASLSSSSSQSLSFFEPRLNNIQKECVERIVKGEHQSYPYVVFGPPGTGKTSTVSEAIRQLLKLNPNGRILAVAPSNSAADVLLERVVSRMKTIQVYRLNAVGRSVSTLPALIKPYSSLTPDGLHFMPKPRAQILVEKIQLVVTTCVSAAALYGLGFKVGDFDHVFVDEAGHATEPECLCALGGLVDATKGRVVLSGDPKQLGPIIRSKLAIKFGLNVSLLERLTRDDEYGPNEQQRLAGQPADRRGAISVYHRDPARGYDTRYISKLLYNYRSHPSILEVPNKLFYENELQAMADKMDRESLLKAGIWPNPAVPVLFHHIEGKEQQEARSPSWFNVDEAVNVMEYAFSLLATKSFGLSYRDVGIISPYSKQVHKLRELARHRHQKLHGAGAGGAVGSSSGSPVPVSELKIGSCEEFQGQERRLILISTVRSSVENYESFDVKYNLGFVNEPKRLNVALTRAKAGLVVVGNGKLLARDNNWRAFLDFCIANKAVKGGLTKKDIAPTNDGTSGGVIEGADALMDVVAEYTASQSREVAENLARERDEEAQEELGQRRNPEAPFNRHE